ncbi:MAG: NUDIX domain-containing protein [Candidatus Paceibacterota bacterium]|jgi:ADP-ribose pyrophosphatase YjhB (NUDIX family)
MNTTENLIKATLCYIMDGPPGHESVLLACKEPTPKAVMFGIANLWNTWGGENEEGETVLETCVRELFAESTLIVDPKDLVEVSRITYDNNGKVKVLVHSFVATKYKGAPRESNEMKSPKWYPIRMIPYDQMCAGDRFVLPVIMSGRKVEGTIYYNAKREVSLSELRLVTAFD